MSSDQPPPNERFVRLLSQNEREIRRYIATLLPDRNAADDVMHETSIALWNKCDEYREDLTLYQLGLSLRILRSA